MGFWSGSKPRWEHVDPLKIEKALAEMPHPLDPPVYRQPQEQEPRNAPPPPSAPAQPRPKPAGPMAVRVVNFDIPMGDLVVFLVKLGIAAIPAVILLGIVYAVLGFLLTALGIGVFGR